MRNASRVIMAALFALPLYAASGQTAAPSVQAFEAAQAARRAMGGEQVIARIFDAMRTQLIGMMAQKGHLTSDKATAICDGILLPAMKAHLPELSNDFANIYARTFTIEELRALTAFYATPLGQKMIEKLPALTVESATAGRTWGERVARQAILDNLQALRNHGIAL